MAHSSSKNYGLNSLCAWPLVFIMEFKLLTLTDIKPKTTLQHYTLKAGLMQWSAIFHGEDDRSSLALLPLKAWLQKELGNK